MDPDAQKLRVISDPTRARILSRMLDSADGRVLVGRLADELGLTQPTVSHHMKALVDEGVLLREPDGRQVWYSIHPEQIDRVAELLSSSVAAEVPEAVLRRISGDLAARFSGSVDAEIVTRFVRDSHERLLVGGVTRTLSSRTAHFAADRLASLSRLDLADHRGAPEVLFVCVQNAGRSQIAAAILRHLAGDRVRVRTAGSEPTSEVRSTIINALDEIGVPIGDEYPKPLTDDAVRAADIVITMGCGDVCPVYPGRRYLDWELDDPVGLPLARVREIRDEIEGRVRELIDGGLYFVP